MIEAAKAAETVLKQMGAQSIVMALKDSSRPILLEGLSNVVNLDQTYVFFVLRLLSDAGYVKVSKDSDEHSRYVLDQKGTEAVKEFDQLLLSIYYTDRKRYAMPDKARKKVIEAAEKTRKDALKMNSR